MSSDRPRLTVTTPPPLGPPEIDNYGPPPLTDYRAYDSAVYTDGLVAPRQQRSPSPAPRAYPNDHANGYGRGSRDQPYGDRRHHHNHRGGGRGRGYVGNGGPPTNPRSNYRRDDNANAAVVFDLLFAIPISVWHRHGFHPPMRFHEERQYFANFYASGAARDGPA